MVQGNSSKQIQMSLTGRSTVISSHLTFELHSQEIMTKIRILTVQHGIELRSSLKLEDGFRISSSREDEVKAMVKLSSCLIN
jgi:hypothetical protein